MAGAVAVACRRGHRIVHRPGPTGPARLRRHRDNAATSTEICRRLDGMPLAIELAAARVRAFSPAEIVDSLHDRFRLLTGGARTAVRRQQTLRASVDWSHALLTEPEQVLFRRLAYSWAGSTSTPRKRSAATMTSSATRSSTSSACWSTSRWSSPRHQLAERATACWRRCASTRWRTRRVRRGR